MQQMTFRRRIYLALLIPTILLALELTVSFIARTRAVTLNNQILEEIVPSNLTIADLQFNSSRLISSANEYLLDAVIEREEQADEDDPDSELEEIEEARASLVTNLATLREIINQGENAEQESLFTTLESAAEALLAITSGLGGQEVEITETIRTQLEDAEVVLLQAVDALLLYEQARYDASLNEISDFALIAAAAGGFIAFIFLTVPLVVAAYLIRSIVRPIEKLMHVAQELGSGNTDARASLDANDEIGQLGLALDAMAIAIQEREQAYAELTASLEQRVARRTNELAIATREAKEANRLKSEFLATMSHELRTPLNAIEGFSSIMLSGMGVELSERAENMVSRISANSKRLLHLVNDILDISRVEAGRMELNPEPLSPNFLAEKWEREVSVLAQEKHLEFSVMVDPQLPEVIHQDEFALTKITINLLSNAFKFTQDGEVTLELLRHDDDLKIVVADTGVGIPFHAQEYIFEEFRQVDGSTTRKFGGTGLGLALVQKLVRSMGGTVRLDSEPGIGSVFTVTLPLNEEPPSEIQTEIETGIPA